MHGQTQHHNCTACLHAQKGKCVCMLKGAFSTLKSSKEHSSCMYRRFSGSSKSVCNWQPAWFRGYLERAIAAHGGYGTVAGQIGWAMAYTPKRPRGYWNSITNVKSEVDDFINANGLQPGMVPSLRDVRGADRSACGAHDVLPVVVL